MDKNNEKTGEQPTSSNVIDDLSCRIADVRNTASINSNQQKVSVRSAERIAEIEEKRSNANTNSICVVDAIDFLQIVKNNTHMADNTLFVRQIWKEKENVGFFFPRRFCKTSLLTMTHFLLNVEIDKETGLPLKEQWTVDRIEFRTKFGQSKILQEKNFESLMLGKRICIKFSLDCINAIDFNELLSEFREKFSVLYKEYSWLKKHLDKDEQETFEKIQKKKADKIDIIYALQNLAKWLRSHFNKMLEQFPGEMSKYKAKDFDRVFIILDNFNYVLHQSFRISPSKIDSREMENFFARMMSTTFEYDSTVRGIIAGYFPISKFKYFHSYTILNAGKKYAEFFGFSEAHFVYLCDTHQIDTKDRETAKLWYNGYTIRAGSEQRCNVYNPQNVIVFLKYLKENPDQPFDPQNCYDHDLKEPFPIGEYAKLFKKDSIAKKIQQLLQHPGGVEMELVTGLNESHIEYLTKANNDPNYDEEPLQELFFTFLLYFGYIDVKGLAENQEDSFEFKKYIVVVPNYLHRQELKGRIKNYYQQRFKEYVQFMPDAQSALEYFYTEAAENKNEKEKLDKAMKKFQEKVQVMLNKLPPHQKIAKCGTPEKEALENNERIFHELFDHMSMSIYNTSRFGTEVFCKCEPKPYADNKNNNVRSDTSFIVFKKKIGIQIEHKFDKKIDEALQQCVTYKGIYDGHLKNECIQRVLFIGTNFFIGSPMQMNYFLYKPGDNDSEQELKDIQNGPRGPREFLQREAKKLVEGNKQQKK